MNFYLGIDFGTSGARAIVIDEDKNVCFERELCYQQELGLAQAWQESLWELIKQIPLEVCSKIQGIAIDGTSSTVLLCNQGGIPITEPLLYNDSRAFLEAEQLASLAPENSPVLSASSSLAKVLWWRSVYGNLEDYYLFHQADWLGFLLHGKPAISDWHNVLKLGYDVENLSYPDWLLKLEGLPKLPAVLAPGVAVGEVRKEVCQELGLPVGCVVCTGTTDSIGAFLASGATLPGEAVTSLGSTLVLKLLSQTRLEDSRFGIYSHRLGNLWLVGGASNSGGAVLRQFFSDAELIELSLKIDVNQPSNLDYYPLIKPGERFPINDSNLPPRLSPIPEHKVDFLHGLLESIAKIEAQGYGLLQQLDATPLMRVYSAGGGAKNRVWQQIRQRYLQVEMSEPVSMAAAYGSALLALQGVQTRL